jgi:hypothetical protein
VLEHHRGSGSFFKFHRGAAAVETFLKLTAARQRQVFSRDGHLRDVFTI